MVNSNASFVSDNTDTLFVIRQYYVSQIFLKLQMGIIVIFNVSVCFLSFGVFLMFCCVVLNCLEYFCFLVFILWVWDGLLCFERLCGHNSRKCIIFKVHDGKKLTFLKPIVTLIYLAHVPKYIWWTFMMGFIANLMAWC